MYPLLIVIARKKNQISKNLAYAKSKVTLDKINISCIESIPQTLVWPSYHQTSAAPNMSQQPQILLPQLQQSLQPPPLALLGSEYLSANCASTTLHQVRLPNLRLALTNDLVTNFIYFIAFSISKSVPHATYIDSQHPTRLLECLRAKQAATAAAVKVRQCYDASTDSNIR